jgi:hypothetical protein
LPGHRLQTIECAVNEIQAYSSALPLNAKIITVLPYKLKTPVLLSLHGEYGTARGETETTVSAVQIVYELPNLDAAELSKISLEQ